MSSPRRVVLAFLLAPAPCWNMRGKTKWPRCRGLSLESAKLRPEDLLYARFDSPALKTFTEQLQQADGLIVATPVYKAAYSGALKTLLDLLPERALQGKVVLPLATGGTVAHLLAVDYALKPVLSALKAQEILHGVFADDSQVIDYHHRPQFTPNLQTRLDTALETFWQALHRRDVQVPDLLSLRGNAHA